MTLLLLLLLSFLGILASVALPRETEGVTSFFVGLGMLGLFGFMAWSAFFNNGSIGQ